MKRLLAILLILATLSFSHKNTPIDFINSHLGLRCGDGCCKDLPLCAIRVSHEWMSQHMREIAFRENHYVERKDIQAGDLIVYFNPINKSGDTTNDYHIGIIYKTINDSTTIIAEQNTFQTPDEPFTTVVCSGDSVQVCNSSRVVLTTINLKDFPVENETPHNHISFYRI